MEDLPIGEIARQAGIRPSELRYYESIGLMPTPKRVNGRRRYDQGTVRMLRVVQLAQRAGFTVAEFRCCCMASRLTHRLRRAGNHLPDKSSES